MTKREAIARANRRARTTGRTYYVIVDPDAWTTEEESYFPCTFEDLETFYAGLPPVYCTAE